MNAAGIFECPPGSRILLRRGSESTETMVSDICASVPDRLKNAAKTNAGAVVSMEMTGEESPNSFRDLAALISRLIAAAGRKSRFEGLLLLNISLLLFEENIPRLKALGEVLSLKDGLASRCVTVFFGADRDREFMAAAECLDFDGSLRAERFESRRRDKPLPALILEAGLEYGGDEAAGLLGGIISEMREDRGFSSLRLLRSCATPEGLITDKSVRSALDNPYSYINRRRRMKDSGSGDAGVLRRTLGFASTDRQ